MSVTLKTIGILGLVLFSLLFGLTYGLPDAVEKSAKGFVQRQLASEVVDKYNEIKSSSITQKALSIAGKLGFEKKKRVTDLENNIPQKIASTLEAMCSYDCEKEKALTVSITQSYVNKISSIEVAEYNIERIIKGKYLEIVENLRFDLRIFLGTNASMFLVLILVAFFKPKAVAQLFVPGILLLTATAVSSCIYIFGQDWFYTILYNDYMGFGYLAYLSIIFVFLMDLTFNSARVTTELLNTACNAIGSSLSFVPC